MRSHGELYMRARRTLAEMCDRPLETEKAAGRSLLASDFRLTTFGNKLSFSSSEHQHTAIRGDIVFLYYRV